MREGKNSWAYLQAYRTLGGPLFSSGHRGIGVHFFCWDGALFANLEELTHKEIEDLLQRTYPTDENARAHADFSTLLLFKCCSAHNAQNSLFWGMCFFRFPILPCRRPFFFLPE